MRQLDFDKFCEEKTRGGKRVFVVLLGDECGFLNSPTHWYHHLPYESYLVRLAIDDFHALDIGRHPKLIYTLKGQELGTTDGFPSLEALVEDFSELLDDHED